VSKHRNQYIKQQLTNNIDLDDLIEIVEGYRQRKYNEDMMAIDKLGGKFENL
jgi:hypothetical protein